jgi:hypothetical protein
LDDFFVPVFKKKRAGNEQGGYIALEKIRRLA